MIDNECAFDRGSQCSALNQKECEKCSFRRTKEEIDAGRKKARERIKDLPADVQAQIRNKYYVNNRTLIK